MRELKLNQDGSLNIVNPSKVFIARVIWRDDNHYFRLVKEEDNYTFHQIPSGYRNIWHNKHAQYACSDFLQWSAHRTPPYPVGQLFEFSSERESLTWLSKEDRFNEATK